MLVCLKGAAQAGASNIEFVENKGQWDSRVKFRGEIGNGNLFLEKGGYTALLYQPDDLTRLSYRRHGGQGTGGKTGRGSDSLRSHAYRMNFVGANDQVTIVPDKALPGYNNYFIGSDPSKWKGNCKVYQGVTYHDLYPGIDIRYYTNAGQLKYDLIVHPGADVSRIRMKYDGVDRLATKKDQLIATTSVGSVTQLSPYSYTFDQRRGRAEVHCRYVIHDGNTVSFDVDEHDAGATLIIDPVIVFSSFTGSKASNWGFTATPGPDGSFFAGGIVWGSSYPYTTGTLQPLWGGGSFDVGILKLSPTGGTKIWATYLGGSDNETPHSMISDAQGDLVVMGRTYSTNFPFMTTAGSGGGADIFVVKIAAAGNSMIGSIRIGGSGDDGVNTADQLRSGSEHSQGLIRNYGDDSRSEVILDGSNNILVTASTQSSAQTGSSGAFPIVGPVFQPNFGGGPQDAVVLKLDPKCTNLIWSSFLGGKQSDAGFVLRVNPLTGDIFVAGATNSTDFPGDKTGVLQGSNNGGIDGFVTQISADGTKQKKTTYLGTAQADAIYGIQFDKSGFPYVMGTTNGVWPVMNVAYFNSGARQFVSKLQPDLSAYVYSTTFGTTSSTPEGKPNISPVAFLIDRCENIYVSGWGGWILGNENDPYGLLGTAGMPVTSNASKQYSDNRDFYFIVLQRNSSSLLYGTYFGQTDNDKSISEHVDGGTSRYDQNGIIYQGICANCDGNASSPFPTTIGAWSTTNAALPTGCNEAAVKIAFNFAGVAAGLRASVNGRLNDTSGCIPLDTDLQDTIRNAKSYIWNFGDGSPDTATTSYEVFHTYTMPGTYTIMMVAIDSSSCNIADTSYRHVVGRTDKALVSFTGVKDPNAPCTSLTYDFTNLSTASKPFGPASFVWNFGDGSAPVPDGTGSLVHSYQSAGTYIVDLFMVDTSYCNYPDTAIETLRVSPVAKAQFVTPATGCAPYTATFNNTSLGGLQFYWNFGDGTPSDSDVNPVHVYPDPGTYTVSLLEIDTTTCNQKDSTQFTITVSGRPTAAFTYSPETPVVNTPFVFSNESIGGVSYKWLFGDGDSTVRTTTDTVQYLYIQTDSFLVCLVTTNAAGCTDTACHAVDALINPLLDVPNAFTPGRFGQNGIIKVMGFGITHMDFRVYNRWGKLVFESVDPAIGWDGTYRGEIQPMDVYAYTLEADFSNGTHIIKKGDITLIR
jgi:gliding motility-associated-like protein